MAALVVALLALGFIALQTLLVPRSTSCQSQAWDVNPAAAQMPSGWVVRTSTYDVGRRTTSIVGPQPSDTTTQQGVAFVTVTCYPDGAADSVTRAEAAARAAGQTVADRQDLGDQAWTSSDSSGAFFAQIRKGNIVAYLAFSGTVTQNEVDQVASAFDLALAGQGDTSLVPVPTQPAGSPGASAGPIDTSAPSDSGAAPSTTPAAPDLEKLLPSTVGTVALTIQSADGPSLLGTDPGSRAIQAALRAAGVADSALLVAQAYDATGTSDLTILAVEVKGMALDKLRQLVVNSWLAASGAGVTSSQVVLSGKTYTRFDYGDQGTRDYVLAENGHVLVITTADAALAAQAAAALP